MLGGVMEPDRKKLSEDIQRQIEKLYLLIDCVEMLPGQQDAGDYGNQDAFRARCDGAYGSGGKVIRSKEDPECSTGRELHHADASLYDDTATTVDGAFKLGRCTAKVWATKHEDIFVAFGCSSCHTG